jgi:hypothetical protein
MAQSAIDWPIDELASWNVQGRPSTALALPSRRRVVVVVVVVVVLLGLQDLKLIQLCRKFGEDFCHWACLV